MTPSWFTWTPDDWVKILGAIGVTLAVVFRKQGLELLQRKRTT